MRRSIAGPVILIAVGVLFLLNNLRPDFDLFAALYRYWPFLLIAFGALRLLEILLDAGSGKPLVVRRGGGSGWIFVILFFVFLAASRHSSQIRFGNWDGGRLEIFGDQFDYPISANGDASGVTMLVLDNLRGNLTVTGTNGDRFEVEGRKQVRAYNKADADDSDRRTRVQFVREGNQLIVRADQTPLSRNRRLSTDLEIKIPKGVSVEARGRSGDLTVNSIAGSVDISSDRGDIRLSSIGGNARVDAAHSSLIRAVDISGAVEIDGNGTDLQAENIIGQVTVSGAYSGTLEFKNLEKPLHFESEKTEIRVQRIPGSFRMDLGDVHASNLVGPVTLRTKSHDVHIADFTDAMEIDVDRGDVGLTPGRQPLSRIDVHSRNGDVDVSLPERVPFDLKANTSQGEVHNDYGPEVRSDSEGRSSSLRSVDGRGPAITISTQRGAVTVRKS